MKNDGIARAKGAKVLVSSSGNTDDIIEAILDAVGEVRGQTREFSRQFSPDRTGMRELWNWVKENIRYKEDPFGVQWIKEPARLWHDRVGDCKSYTLFIVSVLENLGLGYYIKFVNTERRGSKIVNHVYPVAIMRDGEEVVMDAVHTRFDDEHPFYFSKIYDMADIYRLSGIGNPSAAAEIAAYKSAIDEINAIITDDHLLNDLTKLSSGDFARWQQAQLFDAQAESAADEKTRLRFLAAADAVRTGNVSGIGAFSNKDAKKIADFIATSATQTQAAFPMPVLELPNVSGVGSLKDIVGDIVDNIKEAWRKVVNWLFKTAMPGAAPFFLYNFLKKTPGGKTAKRQAKQGALLTWVQKAGKFDSEQAVLNAARAGIVKQYGKQPEAVLNAAAGGQIAGVGVIVAAIIKAVMVVVEIVNNIAKLFKKKGPDVNAQTDAPDLNELQTEYAASLKMGPIGPKSPINTNRGSLPEWVIPAAAVVAAVVILKT